MVTCCPPQLEALNRFAVRQRCDRRPAYAGAVLQLEPRKEPDMARRMNRQTRLVLAAAAVVFAVLGVSQAWLARAAVQETSSVDAPRFEVDPLWPKPLPNHWILGAAIGVAVDADDHIWIVHRGSATLGAFEKTLETGDAECCAGAPPVLEFDQAGNLLRHWGGPGAGYEWPDSEHGITIDYKGNVWIGSNGGPDSHVLKFTKDGKFLLQVGKKGARRQAGAKAGSAEGAQAGFAGNSNDPVSFGRPAKVFVDPTTNEAYIADGYLNKRVAVVDADTGEMKRFWGAYGNKPDDTRLPPYNPDAPPDKQFRNPVHCAEVSNDGLVYVCDRLNDRLQVFRRDGTFVKEAFFAKQTKSQGAAWDVAFSKDPQQRYIFMPDGMNQRVRIIDRQSLQEVTSFGDGGRQPGLFFGVHSIAVDSAGNIYTTETFEGKRLQKFVYKGTGGVRREQGPPWPSR